MNETEKSVKEKLEEKVIYLNNFIIDIKKIIKQGDEEEMQEILKLLENIYLGLRLVKSSDI